MKTKWQNELISSIRTSDELCTLLNLDHRKLRPLLNTNNIFPVNVPIPFLRKIEKGNFHDPLLRQVIPLASENIEKANFVSDAVGDTRKHKVPGLIHKYYNRLLLLLSGNCALHCRYCFRQYFPYESANFNQNRFLEQLNYIQNHPELDEIILSGGDPLSLQDTYLKQIFHELSKIPHIKTIRIHSRFPVCIPSRIDNSFLSLFEKHNAQFVFVYHINHHNEICTDLKRGANELRKRNVTVLNQSVLLKSVNDCPDILKRLSDELFSVGILPYYIHQLDRVRGASHFEVGLKEAKKIMQALKEKSSGYLVPLFVQELENEPNKRSLF